MSPAAQLDGACEPGVLLPLIGAKLRLRHHERRISDPKIQTMPVADQFWGDLMGSLTDPFGHKWSIATHVEDVPPEQFQERMAA